MVNFMYKDSYNVYDLKKLVEVLRGEGGCPWDREQTHESCQRDFIEETYEVIEAINEKSTEHLREELGDVLLQVVFHACMEEEQGTFTLDDAADGVVKKLILRHPHVFGDVTVKDSAEVLSNWDDIKRKEKKQETVSDAMRAVARSLPSLWRAEKVQKKAAKAGVEWQSLDAAAARCADALEAFRSADADNAEKALGRLLFAVEDMARMKKIDPESALNAVTDDFILSFSEKEAEILKTGGSLDVISRPEVDRP